MSGSTFLGRGTKKIAWAVPMAAVFVAASLAGCLNGTDVLDASGAQDGLDETTSWLLEFEGGCVENGFVAPSGMQKGDYLVEPFVRFDVWEEAGRPTINQANNPEGPISGNWHQGFTCPKAVKDGQVVEDFIWGWVGDWVEQPAWDTGGADFHVYTTGLGLENGTFRDTLLDLSKLDVTHTEGVTLDWYPGNVVYSEMWDLPKGVYKSQGPIFPYRDVEERTIRLWWLVPTDGSQSPLGRFHEEDIGAVTDPVDGSGDDDHHMDDPYEKTYHPVYVDLHTGGGQQWASQGGINYSCHGGVPQHGPQGELCLPEITLVYQHASLSLELGRVFEDVVIEDFYWH